MQLLLNTAGLHISLRNNAFRIRTKTDERLISPQRVSTILVTSPVSFHSSAIQLAFLHDIPIYFFNKNGEIEGVFRKTGFANASLIRRNQVLFAENQKAKDWIIRLVQEKLEHQLSNCHFFLNRKQASADSLNEAIIQIEQRKATLDELRQHKLSDVKEAIVGIEGAASRAYWKALASLMPPSFLFEGRSRRPATDYFNAALNYLYGMQYTLVEQALHCCGLDPSIGILHADQYQKPVLAFDFIEPFRGWTERFLVEKIWEEAVRPNFFDVFQEGFCLNKLGKQHLIPQYLGFMHERTTFKNSIRSREAHIQAEAAGFAQFLFNSKF